MKKRTKTITMLTKPTISTLVEPSISRKPQIILILIIIIPKSRWSPIPQRIDAPLLLTQAITILSWLTQSQMKSTTLKIILPDSVVITILLRSQILIWIQTGIVFILKKIFLISSVRKTMICLGKQWSLLLTLFPSIL